MRWVGREGGVGRVRSGLISFDAVEVSILHLFTTEGLQNMQIVTRVLCSRKPQLAVRATARLLGDFHLAFLVLISLSYDSLITHKPHVQVINKWPRNIVAE